MILLSLMNILKILIFLMAHISNSANANALPIKLTENYFHTVLMCIKVWRVRKVNDISNK